MHVSATHLKNNLGQYLEAAVREPVIVDKSGRADFCRYFLCGNSSDF